MDDLSSLLDQLPASSDALRPEVVPAAPAEPPPPEPPVLDLRKHVQKHEEVFDEIFASWRSDRQEAQVAVNFLKSLIDQVMATGQNPTAAMLETYVKAMEVKGNTNAIAVRLLDATAKLIAANRAGVQVTNNTLSVTGTNKELVNALNGGPPSPEDP